MAQIIFLVPSICAFDAGQHNKFHDILLDMQHGKLQALYDLLYLTLEIWTEHQATTDPQARGVMDLILQDLDKIDEFHHNYEMMTHGETSDHSMGEHAEKRSSINDFFRKRSYPDVDFLDLMGI